MKIRGDSQLVSIGLTAAVTAAVTVLARNFISGEKKVKQRIARRYGIADAQFERVMSQLLGPPIVPGNLVTPLRNGAEIFPAMLEAIASAGFTGGVGIADYWMGDAESPEQWRDSHYRVEGPVVAQLQAAFLDNWLKTRAAVFHGDDYFPALEKAGPHRCQMFKSSPMEGSGSARLMYLLSIASAEQSIKVGNAYFVPDDLTTETLVEAVERGVSIEVLVPGKASTRSWCAAPGATAGDICLSAACASSNTSRPCITARS